MLPSQSNESAARKFDFPTNGGKNRMGGFHKRGCLVLAKGKLRQRDNEPSVMRVGGEAEKRWQTGEGNIQLRKIICPELFGRQAVAM